MVIPDHQKCTHGNGEQEWSGSSDPDKAIPLLNINDPSIPFGEDLFFVGPFFSLSQVRSPEGPVPPGNDFFRQVCEEIDPDNSTHIGPQDGLQETESELNDGQGKSQGKLDRTGEYGNQYLNHLILKSL